MNKLIIAFCICAVLFSCNSDDDNASAIEGSRFELINFVIESDIDLNGDGIFSNDLVTEDGSCLVESLTFNENRVNSPLELTLSPRVILNGNNVPVQSSVCAINDFFALPEYEQSGNRILISFNGNLHVSGELSDDDNTLTFMYSDLFERFDNAILREDGSIENYEGGAVAVYRRVQ